VLGSTAWSQTSQKDGPSGLVLPQTRRNISLPGGDPATGLPPRPTGPAGPAAGSCDVVEKGIYKDCRQAAVGALRAGNDAANNAPSNRDRAIGFFLLAIDRDPSYGRVLFNLGVMSARARPERWDDALKFYQEAARLDSSADLAEMLKKELTRVEAISRMESTADGKRARRFDLDLTDLIRRFNDPAVAVETAKQLIKTDPGRWEGPAAAGILQAALTRYADSAASLEAAAQLAPADQRAKLVSAAELAKNEAQFVKAVQQGDTAFESKNYAEAGRLYADAWQASPGRVNTGMQSAISFLLADKVSLAVQVLARIRYLKSPDLSPKAAAMLKELAAISPEAKAAAEGEGSGDVEPVFDVAERIRTLIGDLRTPEILLVTAPAPALAGDPLDYQQLSDDELNHPKETYIVTTESIFDVYLKRVGTRRASPQDATPAAVGDPAAPPPDTAVPDSQQNDAPAPVRPQPLAPRLTPGAAPQN
jgi:tetratricopeptide (TPR) repeat protein